MRIFRWILIGAIGIAGVITTALLGLYRASQSVPSFYEAALQHEPEVDDRAGDEFERQVVELHNDLERGDSWQLILTDDQINGWLASDLEEKFPGLLPKDVEKPRVAFRDGMLHIACRLDSPRIRTVLSFELEAYLTEEPNELAIRIGQVRAGLLPVPLKRVLDRARDAARRADVPLKWAQEDGDPVALVLVPTDHEELRPGVLIERIQVEDGRLIVSGTAEELREHETPVAGHVQTPWRFAEGFGSNVSRQP